MAIRGEKLSFMASSDFTCRLALLFCAICGIDSCFNDLCYCGSGLPRRKGCRHQLGERPVCVIRPCLGDHTPPTKGVACRRRFMRRFFSAAVQLTVPIGGRAVRSSPSTLRDREGTTVSQSARAGNCLAASGWGGKRGNVTACRQLASIPRSKRGVRPDEGSCRVKLIYAETPTRQHVSAHADTPIVFPLERLERIVGNNNGGPASINMPTRAQLGDGMFAVFFEQQCCSGGDQNTQLQKR
jgi:hypothetical protein